MVPAGSGELNMHHKPLFVYGTLRHNQRNSVYHGLSGSCTVIENVVLPGHNLYDLGAFPGIKPGDGSVVGDVFMVPDDLWDSLDAYEGVPNLYTRQPVDIAGFDQPVQAYIYEGQVVPQRRIANGNWLQQHEG